MKAEIHPKYEDVTVTCSCGNNFKTMSSMTKAELKVEVCSECHPFYTGKQKIIDTAGRVDSFNRKFSNLGQKKPAVVKPVEVQKDKKTKK